MRRTFNFWLSRPALSLLMIMIPVVFYGCKEDIDEDPLIYGGSWIKGWPELGHDGNIIESPRIVLYSNYASQETREYVIDEAEKAIDYLLERWDVTWDDFDFLTTYRSEKIHVFADHDQGTNGGLAYRDGIIIRSPGSPRYIQFGWTEDQWLRTLRHEISHVMEFLLIGNPAHQQANSVWLREGGASYGAGIHTVQTADEINAWEIQMKDVEGQGNPIRVNVWSDFPLSVRNSNTTINYYKFFELTTRYLCDSEGNGTTKEDLKSLYEDLGAGVRFETAFEDNFGITVEYLEENWWELMRDYLK